MDLHKPKPWHGWREFLKELGTIALGVAIALAAEQAVEWLHWRAQVSDAKEAIASEMARDIGIAILRLRTETCVEQRLDELNHVINASIQSGRLPPIGNIARPASYSLSLGVWDSVVSSQTATHFPRPYLANLALNYRRIQRMSEDIDQEASVWNDLDIMVGPGGPLDPVTMNNLRKSLSHARFFNRFITSLSAGIIRNLKQTELPFSPQDLAVIARARGRLEETYKVSITSPYVPDAVCQPIGQAPQEYGQSHDSAVPDLVGDELKNLPDFSKNAP